MWNSFATSNEIGRVLKLAFIVSSGTFWGKSKLNETVFRFSPCFDFEQKHWVELSHLLPRCRGECSERKYNFEPSSIFFNLSEWFPVELRTTIHVSRRTIPTTFFWKISFLFWFSDFEQNSCKTFPEMLSAIFSELTSLCPEDQIEKTSVSWKIQTFFNNSGLWAITWYKFWQKWFRQACHKWLLLVRRNFLKRTIFRKLLQKWLVSESGQKTFGTMLKLFFVSSGTVLEIWTFWGKSMFFLSIPHIMWTFSSTSNETCRAVKLAFIISNGTFWGKSRLNETVFRFSPRFDSEQKTLCRVLTSPSYASRGTLWRKTVFWNDLLFQCGWMTSGAVENRNLRVQKNFFGDFLLENYFFVLIVGFWAKIL